MDNCTLNNLEGGVDSCTHDVGTNSTNVKDTDRQDKHEDSVTLSENNETKNANAVACNKTEESAKVMGDNPNISLSNTPSAIVVSALSNLDNADSLYLQNFSGKPCQSLMNILGYGSDSSSEDSEPDSVDLIQDSKSSDSTDSDWEDIPSSDINNTRNYRDNRCLSSGNSSDSNESFDEEIEVGATGAVKTIPKKIIRTEGELELDELPPVPDLSKLSLNVKTEDCIQMGKISNIVDRLVTVDSLPNIPAYDLDTLLFLDQGKVPLGYVYDVMGQVTSPIYVIRFNSKEEIESRGITKGLPVYCAPNTEHTQFVFLKELLKMKGTDASWQGDNEVPLDFVDFSDDEIEFSRSKHHINEKLNQMRKRKRNSIDKHRIFESTMNLKNQVNSARYKIHDVKEPPVKRDIPKRNPKVYYHQSPPCPIRPPISSGFNSYHSSNFSMAPNFNLTNMPTPAFNIPSYSMMSFPPNPQFPPPSFGSPAIPPLPHLQHISVQPPPPGYPGSIPMLPTGVCKPTPHTPKMHQNTGVVPKIPKVPKAYLPINFNYHNLDNFSNNTRQNMPPLFGPQPYNPPYNKNCPNNTGGNRFKNP